MRAAAATRMPSVGRVLAIWLEEYGPTLKEGTRTRAASYVRNELQYFARMHPTLTYKCVWEYVEAQIAEGKKPGTIAGGLIWLRRALCILWDCDYEAIAWEPPVGRRFRSPARHITTAMKHCRDKFAHLDTPTVAATPADCELLLQVTREIAPEWSPFMQLAIGTGMRRSELRALRWDCVDLRKGTLLLRRNFSLDEIGSMKTGAQGVREVHLSPGCVALLRELRKGVGPELVAGDEYVFTYEGHFLRQYRVGHAMAAIFGEAEKRGMEPGRSLHALRRHYVSQGREHMSDAWLQNQVGHSAASQKTYTKPSTVKAPNLDWIDF